MGNPVQTQCAIILFGSEPDTLDAENLPIAASTEDIVLLAPFLYIIWKYSYPFVYRSFLMNEVSREAGGMPALFVLKSAILWFCLVLFLQLISNVSKSIQVLLSKENS